MADILTSNYSYVMPEVGASEDTWGQKLNQNWLDLDSDLKALADSVASISTNKADIDSPALTGSPTAPTVSPNTDSSTKIATTAFVQSALSNVDLSTKANIASPTFTGTVNAGDKMSLGSWSIWDSGGTLYFQYGSDNVFKIDSSGNITAQANVTAYGSV